MSRLLDALLTTDPVQRVRLAQPASALVLLAVGVLGMDYLDRKSVV